MTNTDKDLARVDTMGEGHDSPTAPTDVAGSQQPFGMADRFIPKRACEGAETWCLFNDTERQCKRCDAVLVFSSVPTLAETTVAFRQACELAKADGAVARAVPDDSQADHARIQALEAKLTHLEASRLALQEQITALAEYAQHKPDCKMWVYNVRTGESYVLSERQRALNPRMYEPYQCTCGLAPLLSSPVSLSPQRDKS